MSPFIAYHATARRHRENIYEHGLIAGSCMTQPANFGVYVFNDDCPHPTFSRVAGTASCWWGRGGSEDCWQVAYVGPMSPDQYVENGMLLHESVPPQHLSLITHITDNIVI